MLTPSNWHAARWTGTDAAGPPVHAVVPSSWTGLSPKISRTTLSLPICQYNRTTRALLLFDFLSLLAPFALIENGGHAVGLGLLPNLNPVVVDLEPGGQFGHRLLALHCLQNNFDLKGQWCFLRFLDISLAFSTAVAVLGLGTESPLRYLSKFPSPPRSVNLGQIAS